MLGSPSGWVEVAPHDRACEDVVTNLDARRFGSKSSSGVRRGRGIAQNALFLSKTR